MNKKGKSLIKYVFLMALVLTIGFLAILYFGKTVLNKADYVDVSDFITEDFSYIGELDNNKTLIDYSRRSFQGGEVYILIETAESELQKISKSKPVDVLVGCREATGQRKCFEEWLAGSEVDTLTKISEDSLIMSESEKPEVSFLPKDFFEAPGTICALVVTLKDDSSDIFRAGYKEAMCMNPDSGLLFYYETLGV